MKLIYISIAVILVGGIGYGIYTYVKNKKESLPATPVTGTNILPVVKLPYNVLTDPQYNAKIAILKGPFYQKITRGNVDFNSFATSYLPIELADLRVLINATLAGDSQSPINIAKVDSIKLKYKDLPVWSTGGWRG